MPYSTSISINADSFKLIRKVIPSSVAVDEHIVYEYKRKVYTPATKNYDAITGPIERKGILKSILNSDKQGGEITPAQYTAVMNDAASSLSL